MNYEHIQRWTLLRRKGASVYQLRYILKDGTVRERSTKESVKRNAERRALQILKEVDEEGALEIYGWQEFCIRYEAEHLSAKPYKTQEAFRTACARFDSLCPDIRFVSDITAKVLVVFAVRLRAEGKSEATIQAYRDHIMSSLKWAVEMEIISKRPSPPALGRVPTGTRGRALTEEEFERMIAQLPSVVGEQYAERWEWNMRGLWLSGLRLGETLTTFWEPNYEGHYIVGIDNPRPLIHISQFAEKAFRDRELPLTPDFVEHLRTIDARKRNGTVFKWPLSRGYTTNLKTISKRISWCGKQANIVVGRNKTASSHDLRRSYGSRWAIRVKPFILKTLMRHSSITTTERYYVSLDANDVGAALYSAAEDTGLEPAAP